MYKTIVILSYLLINIMNISFAIDIEIHKRLSEQSKILDRKLKNEKENIRALSNSTLEEIKKYDKSKNKNETSNQLRLELYTFLYHHLKHHLDNSKTNNIKYISDIFILKKENNDKEKSIAIIHADAKILIKEINNYNNIELAFNKAKTNEGRFEKENYYFRRYSREYDKFFLLRGKISDIDRVFLSYEYSSENIKLDYHYVLIIEYDVKIITEELEKPNNKNIYIFLASKKCLFSHHTIGNLKHKLMINNKEFYKDSVENDPYAIIKIMNPPEEDLCNAIKNGKKEAISHNGKRIIALHSPAQLPNMIIGISTLKKDLFNFNAKYLLMLIVFLLMVILIVIIAGKIKPNK